MAPLDRDLLRRHDRPGPRYTSYPTAPAWSSDVDGSLLTDGLAALPADDPVSVYVHVPFCRDQCTYCGCHMVVARRQDAGDRFLDALARQVEALPLPAETMPMARLHLGGGTPTWLNPAQLDRLVGILRRRFEPTPDHRASVEAEPVVTTDAHLDVLGSLGFRRVSFGVQSLDPVVQEAVARPLDLADLRRVVDGSRARGMASVNIDLMYGLPQQTPEGWARTLDAVLDLAPDRLAVFGYAHVPWLKKHQARLDEAALPDGEARLTLLLQAHATLEAAGYVPVGFDHFARPDDDLAAAARAGTLQRDFMGYTARPPGPLVGLGPSAISQLPDRFAQQEPNLGRWWKAVEAGELPVVRGLVLTDDDRLRRDAIDALTTRGDLDLDALGARHGVDAADVLGPSIDALAPLATDGIVDVAPRRVRVLPRGRLLVRNVAMAFDAHLGHRPGRFSRVV